MELILASTSPYRRGLVERLGIPLRCLAPGVDEGRWKAEAGPIAPGELAAGLALAKATAVAANHPEAAVIGGDQLVSLDGRILGKPGTAGAAAEQLGAMAGRTHELITAIAVIHAGKTYAHANVTTLTLRPLTPEEIARYVEADSPLDSAGSYKLEARGIALFERIESDDHSAIIGVPLIALTSILREIGFMIP